MSYTLHTQDAPAIAEDPRAQARRRLQQKRCLVCGARKSSGWTRTTSPIATASSAADWFVTQTRRSGRNAVDADQLSLFSQGLAPLNVRDVVRTPEGWIGEVCQVWPGRDYYVVFAKCLSMHKPLPTFRRDELELLGEAERAAVWETGV